MIRMAGCLAVCSAMLLLPGCDHCAHAESVSIIPATSTLKVGQTIQFGLDTDWSSGTHCPTVPPRWSIDNPDVVSLDHPSGAQVTGKSPGNALLTGCIGDVCDSRVLTVTP